MRLPVSSSLRRRLCLPHPVRRRAPTAGTVGLRNPASREPVRVRGNQVFGERSGATTGSTTSSSDDEFLHTDNFFPDLSNFFDNLNMGDNDAAVNRFAFRIFWIVAVPTRTWAAPHDLPEPHYISADENPSLYVPHMRLPVSSSLRRRFRLPHPVRRRAPTAGTVGLRNPASREPVRVRGNQVFGERSGATTGSTTSSSDDEFLHTDNFFPDLSNFFDNLNMGDNDAAVNATDARPEGPLSAEEQEKFEKVDAMFKAALFSILGDNIVDPYMAFDHGKDAWDALEAKFGVSDAGTELYVMEQYYDYRMTDERSVVEQAHEIQSLAKELEQFKCTLPDKFVAGGIIAKLPPSWRNFATSLKHKRQEFSVSDLIGSLHVEEKARAKDTRARSFEGGSANVVQKKNFQSHKSKNKNNGKGKFDEKNKASNSTNFKRKTPYKKKGNCHVCGAPGHWAPDCPERHDRRGNSGRKDFLRADGKRLTCFCSWCWKLTRSNNEAQQGEDDHLATAMDPWSRVNYSLITPEATMAV
ncbi:hypothetical protein QYE76_049531 [Lolium multiflorum]|uniref:CCHC-type domain-containing protein n=1 Tax=Lolium multiflorum TaxID=4521 RepID=A0AAD8WG54_LOLMU|nr:hypothetical protein QYE76_049531 [Lolium multiflorum]